MQNIFNCFLCYTALNFIYICGHHFYKEIDNMGLKDVKLQFKSSGPTGRHLPKNGITNKKYAADHNVSVRQASKLRRNEKWNQSE